MSPAALLAAALLAAPAPAPGPAAALGSCYRCHSGLGGDLAKPAEAMANDVHAQPGLGCAGCHGGDPTSDDPTVAMSRAKGFRGVPARPDVPRFCGGCHADAAFVKRYLPNLPTDQLPQYLTSVHAAQLAKGNAKAAVCTSCHGYHGIVSTKDSRSPVYPTHVVDTCARCHAAAGPKGPVASWRRSVHAAALASGDLSAPTCPRCHGAHGATPPGVQSVANVCGQCHPQNMDLYRASPHGEAFAAAGLGSCETCHHHHDIEKPTDAFVGIGPGAVCGNCHTRDDGGGEAATLMHGALGDASGLLQRARERTAAATARGMLLVDAAVQLEDAHQDLVLARTLVHSADLAKVQAQTGAAATASRKALSEASAAFAELRYRRAGLLVALAVILVAVVALVLRIRRIDERA